VKSKKKSIFTCQNCGSQRSRWEGRCSECGAWNSYVEETYSETAGKSWVATASAKDITTLSLDQSPSETKFVRWDTGTGELNRVLGGGLVQGDYQQAYTDFQELGKTMGRRHRVVMSSSQERTSYWKAMSLFRMGQLENAREVFESLSRSESMGFYSIAARYRIKKIDSLTPKRKFLFAKHRASPIGSNEVLMSMDESWTPPIEAVSEENESEDAIVSSQIETEPEGEAEELSTDSMDGIAITQEGDAKNEDGEVKNSFSSPILVRRFGTARDLIAVGMDEWAKWELYEIERQTSNKEYLKTLMSEYASVGNFNRSSYIGQVYFSSQRVQYGIEGVRFLWEATFPKAFEAEVKKYTREFSVPPELVWAIMRAESQYRKDAISPVGAMGLMQIMPSTGLRVAHLLNDKLFEPRRLLEAETAIKIGSRYLQRLLRKFENNVALAAAAYNAGPHRVQTWLGGFGQLDLDEFIDHIPFLETRNYVKKVLGNYFAYSQIYNREKDVLNSVTEPIKVRFTSGPAVKESWEDI